RQRMQTSAFVKPKKDAATQFDIAEILSQVYGLYQPTQFLKAAKELVAMTGCCQLANDDRGFLLAIADRCHQAQHLVPGVTDQIDIEPVCYGSFDMLIGSTVR